MRNSLYGGSTPAAGRVAAVADLGDDAFEADLAGVREHLFAVDLKTFAELDGCLLDQLFQVRLALEEWQLPQILAVEIEQIEGDHDEPVGLAAQLVLQHGEIRGAVCCRNDHFAVDDGTAGVDQ